MEYGLILLFVFFLLPFLIYLPFALYRAIMTLLQKEIYPGYTQEFAKTILGCSGSFVLCCTFVLLYIFLKPPRSPNPKYFSHFINIEITPDIVLLHANNSSHDEFNSYSVCFRFSEDSIKRIVSTNVLKQMQEIVVDSTTYQKAGSCLQGKAILYKVTVSDIEKILLYNKEKQTAWYNYFGIM